MGCFAEQGGARPGSSREEGPVSADVKEQGEELGWDSHSYLLLGAY